MRIYKISSLRNRVAQYGITDPVLVLFVRKYENVIPWGELHSAKNHPEGREAAQYQLNDVAWQMIRDHIVPSLEKDSENSVFVNDIDLEGEAMQNNDNPDVVQAVAQHRRDPAAAREQILEIVNSAKEETFDGWWDYMNESYDNNPAFFYMMMRSLTDSYGGKTTNPPPPVNAHALDEMFSSVDGNDMNFTKEFFAAVQATGGGGRQTFEEGWVMVPGKPRSIEDESKWGKYEDNLSTLRTYGSAGGWCIGGPRYSNEYLSQGDFYILVEHGNPMIALRCRDNTLQEIAGRGNSDKWISDKWENILGFLGKSDVTYEGTNAFKKIEKQIKFNKELEGVDGKFGLSRVIAKTMGYIGIQAVIDIYPRMTMENKS